MRRAAELEAYDPESEFTLGGDEEGWTATHNDPAGDSAAAAAEVVPDMDAAGDNEEDIPDMGDLELAADDDEVGRHAWHAWRSHGLSFDLSARRDLSARDLEEPGLS